MSGADVEHTPEPRWPPEIRPCWRCCRAVVPAARLLPLRPKVHVDLLDVQGHYLGPAAAQQVP